MWYYVIPVGIIVLDQISKFFAVKYLRNLITYPLIQDVFHLTYVKNDGAAFSILKGKQSLLIIVTFIVIIGLIYYLHQSPKTKRYLLLNISLMFVIGGAIGNLIDRIRLGYVIDYFDFRLINFAVFNVADSFITVGTIGLIIVLLLTDLEI